MLRRLLVGNILLESFDVVFVLIKQARAKSASQENALGTGSFNPHWHFLHLWKITLQRDEHFLYPPRGKALNTQRVHFPIWKKLLFQCELFSSVTKGKVLPPFNRRITGLWVLFSCEIFACWIQYLIFKKAASFTLLVFICIAAANGTLSIKLPYCASWEFYASQPTPSPKLYF